MHCILNRKLTSILKTRKAKKISVKVYQESSIEDELADEK
jgi:hypothetical protein